MNGTTTAYVRQGDRVERDWVIAAQRGDRQALGHLFERYQQLAFGIAYRRLGNRSEAQEVCQDAFVQVLRKLHQLRDADRFAGWLRAIVQRQAIHRAVRRHRWTSVDTGEMELTCIVPGTALSDLLARERAEDVRVGLLKLRPLDRETLEAFYLQGQSLQEMSRRFAAPVGTIKRRLHTARRRLTLAVESSMAI